MSYRTFNPAKRFSLAALAIFAGCVDADTGDDPGGASTVVSGVDASTPSVAQRGRTLLTSRGCVSCHDPGDGSFRGQTTPRPGTQSYGSNLSPDERTGLGGWSDAQIVTAIRDGVDPAGAPLCSAMPRYSTLSDTDAHAIVVALRVLDPVESDVPESQCERAEGPADLASPPDASLEPPSVDAGTGVGASDGPDLGVVASLPDLASATMRADLSTVDQVVQSGACHVVINEVQTGTLTSANDEFIELYNPCPAAQTLGGARLVYRAASGKTDVTLAHLPAAVVPPGAFFLCASATFVGKADATYTGALASAGGSVAVIDAGGVALDSVGWGNAANAYVRGGPAPAPGASQSTGRFPDGADTATNSVDFRVSGRPSPGTTNH